MSVKNKRSLGRGLDALFEDKKKENVKDNLLTSLPIELIKPNPLQPRKNFSKETLNELAASIKDRGVLQPIIVRPAKNKDNEWEIIAGERRWKAAQLAGFHEVPVSIKDIKDEDVAIIALIVVFEFTIGKTINKISSQTELLFTKEGRKGMNAVNVRVL